MKCWLDWGGTNRRLLILRAMRDNVGYPSLTRFINPPLFLPSIPIILKRYMWLNRIWHRLAWDDTDWYSCSVIRPTSERKCWMSLGCIPLQPSSSIGAHSLMKSKEKWTVWLWRSIAASAASWIALIHDVEHWWEIM